MRRLDAHTIEYTHFHLFCGLGGGAAGFNQASARVGDLVGVTRCIGGVDVDPAAIRDFEKLAGVPGTVLDLFSLQQYIDFHGEAPPNGWCEVTAEAIRVAAGGEFPDMVFLSAPCKGFSGLLNSKSARSRKYRALNLLTVRGIGLMLEAFADDLPRLIVFENVPRIATRGEALLDVIHQQLAAAGYAVSNSFHDCGEIGGLAQHRRRFLLVARLKERVRPFLYEPPKKRLRTVGEVIGSLPLPDHGGNPMHRCPRLQWRTWLRLALIKAGSDWRSLNELNVEDGFVKGLGIVPTNDYFPGSYGVKRWEDQAATVTGRSGPTTGAFSVADPRAPRDLGRYQPYGVVGWDEQSRTVTSEAAPGAGPYSVADPRAGTAWGGKGKYHVAEWDGQANTVIAASGTGNGASTIADPRLNCDVNDKQKRRYNNVYRVVRWDGQTGAVTSGAGPTSGGQAVADPRVGCKSEGGSFASAKHYGVLPWTGTSDCVNGHASHDNGAFSVADPRLPEGLPAELPGPRDRPDPVPIIISLDGTWHRPFTTLELAAIQGIVTDDTGLVLDGEADTHWRGRIGNAVPPGAAKAVGTTMLHTLLLEEAGTTFVLSSLPIWVQPMAIALSVDTDANDRLVGVS